MSATLFVILAALGAAFSAVFNLRAFLITRSGPWRNYFALVTVLSVFYVGAWGALLLSEDLERGDWSEVVTPISTLTFFTVWVGPALLLVLADNKETV